jgi:hypothetical protein
MKKGKLLIAIVLALLVFTAGVYILIPGKLPISANQVIDGTLLSTTRSVSDSNQWRKWWPDSPASKGPLMYKGFSYRIAKGLYNAAEVTISNDTRKITSRFTFLPINKDSVMVDWRCEVQTRSLPWQRINDNLIAGQLSDDMQHLLKKMKAYIENPQHIYGIPVTRTKVKDTLLIVTKANFAYPPTIEETYRLINILKTHALQENVPQTGSPMLHVLPVNPGYEVMVALPVGRAPKKNEKVSIRRMVPGNILVTEVKGGPWTIANAFQQLQNYVYDHRYESPAKPFQSLVTKRDVEKDTSQWVTRIYYPIF